MARIVPSLILALAVLGATAAAAGGPDSREYAATAKFLGTLTPGKPVDCLPLTRSRPSRFLDRDTIVYTDGTRRAWVNRTNGGCRFSGDSIVVTSTPSDRLCRGDIIRLIDRASRFPTGSCSFGDFVPYQR